MKIAFFGTYFLFFEKIIQNCIKESDSQFFLFTDKNSFSNIFKNINTSYVYLKNHKEIDKYNLSKEEIRKFFICDEDRQNEFNLQKPSLNRLNKTANIILESFEKWYCTNQPDILISEGPNNFFNRVIIDYLEKNKIDHFQFRMGRIAKSVYLEKNKKTILNSNFKNKINLKQDYMSSKSATHRKTFDKLANFKQTSLYLDLTRIIKFWPIVKREDKLLPYSGKSIEVLLKIRFLYIKKSLLKIFLQLINFKSYSGSQEYLIYTEHYRPESSTSAYDLEYINDLKNIKSFENKIESKLLFRFHPTYFTKRPLIQFIKILIFSGKFISTPKQSVTELIKNSQGAITISSSLTLDAIKLGKPSIVLGHPEYLNSEIISKNLLVIRNESDFFKIDNYRKNYKKMDSDILDLELKKLYHPFSIYDDGKWINIIIKEYKKEKISKKF